MCSCTKSVCLCKTSNGDSSFEENDVTLVELNFKVSSSTERFHQEKHSSSKMGLLTEWQILIVTVQRFKLYLNMSHIIERFVEHTLLLIKYTITILLSITQHLRNNIWSEYHNHYYFLVTDIYGCS